jgi:hypothetical protein
MEVCGQREPRPLYWQGKSLWHPLNRRLGGPQSRSGRCGEKKNSQPPPGIEPKNLDRPGKIINFHWAPCHEGVL